MIFFIFLPMKKFTGQKKKKDSLQGTKIIPIIVNSRIKKIFPRYFERYLEKIFAVFQKLQYLLYTLSRNAGLTMILECGFLNGDSVVCDS